MSTSRYKSKVELLLRIVPIITGESVFAIHGGTAINLFVKNFLRYSVDIDLTYLPLKGRQESINEINDALRRISDKIKKALKGTHVSHREDICKLLCTHKDNQVKIEVNQTKRGVVCGEVELRPLCLKAQEEFSMYCEANIVPTQQLYGGKVAAALSRQHPRDIFDVRYMDISLSDIKNGLLFCLLGSDRPIHESLAPHLIDQRRVMETQFEGMTKVPFSYKDYEETRNELVKQLSHLFSNNEKRFLISFKEGVPDWELLDPACANFEEYPSIQWKLLNIRKLKEDNPNRLKEQLFKLKQAVRLD